MASRLGGPPLGCDAADLGGGRKTSRRGGWFGTWSSAAGPSRARRGRRHRARHRPQHIRSLDGPDEGHSGPQSSDSRWLADLLAEASSITELWHPASPLGEIRCILDKFFMDEVWDEFWDEFFSQAADNIPPDHCLLTSGLGHPLLTPGWMTDASDRAMQGQQPRAE